MIPRATIAAALAGLTLAAAPVATASQLDFRAADTYPELGAALRVARATFPGPCVGREFVAFQDGPLAVNEDGTSTVGWAWPRRCAVELDHALVATPRLMCALVVHEWGHLAGREHAADPRDIMHPIVPAFAPCQNIPY